MILILEEKQHVIKTWIRVTLMEKVLYFISGLSTAKEVWKSLEQAFAEDTKDRKRSLIHNPQL